MLSLVRYYLPAALAMVELARVPLAIAVRTQDAWHIKLLATLGVLAAITNLYHFRYPK